MIGWMLGSDARIACTLIALAWVISIACVLWMLLTAPVLERLDAELDADR